MTSFRELLDTAQSVNSAVAALETASDSRAVESVRRYEAGLMQFSELRKSLETQARSGFVTSGAIGYQYVIE